MDILTERRDFLKACSLGLLAAHSCSLKVNAMSDHPPNLLIIMTDQQFADGMSCVLGRSSLHTPHMDALAESGMRFTRAYSPNPLCMPMRTSMFTGRYPHETGLQENNGKYRLDANKFTFMGKLFKNAGYETAYFGKWHIAFGQKDRECHGFETLEEKEGRLSPSPAVRFLKGNHSRPFLMVASFLGPHEICQWARKEGIPGSPLRELPPPVERPLLKPNHAPPKNETDIMNHMRRSFQGHKLFPVGDYDEADWRRLTWGYYRLIERVDEYVGAVTGALQEAGLQKDTIVLFLSDHGDCHGAHKWNQKTVFYDESSRVPFIISWPGKTPAGTSDVLLNVGIDVIPTLCDFAGIAVPSEFPGKSLKAPALGHQPSWDRDYIISQNHMVQCVPVNGVLLRPHGRMVRSAHYKYCLYSEGEHRESLVDMEADPGEMVNLAASPSMEPILRQHRRFLKEHADKHDDAMAREMLAAIVGN